MDKLDMEGLDRTIEETVGDVIGEVMKSAFSVVEDFRHDTHYSFNELDDALYGAIHDFERDLPDVFNTFNQDMQDRWDYALEVNEEDELRLETEADDAVYEIEEYPPMGTSDEDDRYLLSRARDINQRLRESDNQYRIYYDPDDEQWYREFYEDIEVDYPGKEEDFQDEEKSFVKRKALSYLNDTSGGALVRPPRVGPTKRKRKRLESSSLVASVDKKKKAELIADIVGHLMG
jgi:hypothetical protein